MKWRFFQTNEVEFERFGRSAGVPNNPVAHLMYYLNCVCSAIDCDRDSEVQPFTTYANWSSLTTEEQNALLVVYYALSPDVLNDRVFSASDILSGDS